MLRRRQEILGEELKLDMNTAATARFRYINYAKNSVPRDAYLHIGISNLNYSPYRCLTRNISRRHTLHAIMGSLRKDAGPQSY